MPFNKETAAEAGRKGKGGNRWGDKDPATKRDRRVSLAFSQSELDAMDAKAKDRGLSRAELIVQAVSRF